MSLFRFCILKPEKPNLTKETVSVESFDSEFLFFEGARTMESLVLIFFLGHFFLLTLPLQLIEGHADDIVCFRIRVISMLTIVKHSISGIQSIPMLQYYVQCKQEAEEFLFCFFFF